MRRLLFHVHDREASPREEFREYRDHEEFHLRQGG